MSSPMSAYSEIALAVDNYEKENPLRFLKALESDDPLVVWQAIRGCGLKKITEAVPRLVQILGEPCEPLGADGNTDLRRIAASSLAEIGFETVIPYLVEIEKNENVLLREGFADLLGMTEDRRALPILDRLMVDQDYSVRLWTALSLSKHGDKAVPILERHLRNKPDKRTTVYLLDALKKIGTPLAIKTGQEYLVHWPDEQLNTFWNTKETHLSEP
jgi:hypothetical protein